MLARRHVALGLASRRVTLGAGLARSRAAGARRSLSTSTVGAPPAPASSAAGTAAAAEEELSWLGWPIRNPITTLFLVAGSTWAYTLWIGNKARQRREEEEELVKSRMPATADELLELRALNDVPTAAIASLPAEAARVGCKEGRAPREQLVLLLRRAAAAGQPLKEEYVVERLLMAIPDAEPGSGTVDVRRATCALTFLTAG